MWQLLVLLVLAVPIAVIALVIVAVQASGRMARLEARLTALETQALRQARLLESLGSAQAPVPPETTQPSVPTAAPIEPLPPVEAPAPPPEPPVAVAAASVEPPPAVTTPAPVQPPRRPVWAQAAAEQLAAAPADDGGTAPPPPTPPVPPHPPAAHGFEWERFIGLRLPIWLGAIALCVAGFFTPSMRVLSAAAAALAFLAGAEFVRRRVKTGNPAAISSALSAASIATAYATAYLASITYGLVSTGFGFIATVAVSVLAIAIALAYGQVVALLGIVGAYIAPAVYGGGPASAPFLMIYVTAITAASYVIIRYKSWWRLSAIGLIGPAFWILVWAATPDLLGDGYWSDAFLLAIPIIVVIATWPGWREDGDITSLRGLTGLMTPQRGTLIGAVIVAAVGFAVFVTAAHGDFVSLHGGLFGYWTGFDIRLWQGFIVYAALAVALGFASSPHRALQVPILIAYAVALLLWTGAEPTAAYIVVGAGAIIFGFGALDQFRRLREPGFWAAILSFVALYFFAIVLWKVNSWDVALANKHAWAAAALVIAAAFVGLLRIFGPAVPDGLERSRVFAAWGAVVTSLVSLALVLELDPLYFPAATAIAILGLAAVHLRARVRGLRILATAYLVIYGLLMLGAFAYDPVYSPIYNHYVFANAFDRHAIVLLVLPGIAILGAATLFQRNAAGSRLIPLFDIIGFVALAIGLYYLFNPGRGLWRVEDVYITGGKIAPAELALALAAIDLGRIHKRPIIFNLGMILAGLVSLGMLGAFILPLLSFWPPFAVPGTVIINWALLTLALPALLLFGIGWLIRKEDQPRRTYGIVISVFAVLVTYTLMVVDIRQAWHLGSPTLQGDMSQSEFYAYSIGTLLFGIALLVIGVAFRHRGARALSFIFVLAATIKVFLVDAAELEGLWRVLSFLLMGLSFLGISWAYARFVFGIGVRPPPVPPPTEPAAK